MANNTTTCGYSNTGLTQIIIYTYSTTTIMLNILVLVIAAKYVNLKRRLEQWFVVNMTLADLIFSLVFTTTMEFNLHIPWFLCRPYFILIWTSSISSVMFLLMLNVHKLVTLFFPFYSLVFMRKRKIFVQIVLCWSAIMVSSIVFSLKPTFRLRTHDCYQCLPEIDPIYYLIRLIALYILPVILSIVISSCIVILAQKRSHRTKNLFQRILFVFSSTLWCGLTFLPHRIITSKLQLCKYYESKSNWDLLSKSSAISTLLTNTTYNSSDYISRPNTRTNCIDETNGAFTYLFAFGMVMNPLITILTQKKYRQGVWDLMRRVVCMKPRRKLTRTENSTYSDVPMYRSYSVISRSDRSYSVVSKGGRNCSVVSRYGRSYSVVAKGDKKFSIVGNDSGDGVRL